MQIELTKTADVANGWSCRVANGHEANGTHLQGYATASYDRLVELLGPCIDGDVEDKVTTEWVLVFTGPNGEREVATLYDWKEYSLRCRRAKRYDWHVGGMSKRAVTLVTQLLAG